MNKIMYGIIEFDTVERSEYPLDGAKTDGGARRKAVKLAAEMGIKDYKIVFYRSSDGCRGIIDR